MTKPCFSLIIPTLNEARYLPKLLSDLVSQSFQDFEVIVVDGGSTDKTITLANSFKSKLKLTILKSPKAHVCTQRNLGAHHANANILVFSDADNRFPPYFLLGIKYRWESAKSDILTTWFKPDISTPGNDTIALGMNIAFELQQSLSTPILLESFIVITKSAFDLIGGFDDNIRFAEGRQFAVSALKNGLTTTIVKDPHYYFSFRRFRKYGTLKLMRNTATLGLSNLLGQNFKNEVAPYFYPMTGGKLFNQPKRVKNKFLKNITKLLNEL